MSDELNKTQTTTQVHLNLKHLRSMVDQLGGAVNQQQTMITTRDQIDRQEAMQSSDDMARLFVDVRRTLEELERRIEAQEKEHIQLMAMQDIGRHHQLIARVERSAHLRHGCHHPSHPGRTRHPPAYR